MSGRSSFPRSSSSRTASSRGLSSRSTLIRGGAAARSSSGSNRPRHRQPTPTSTPTATASPSSTATHTQSTPPRAIAPSSNVATTTPSNSNSNSERALERALLSGRGAPPGPSSARVSDEAMRLLKRMRPEELREISKAANELEKAKLEDKQKVAGFLAKNDNFVDLVGDCYVCLEPLLNNIGTTKFGVLSWRCRCTVAQKAHSACLFAKICHGQGTCDMCHGPMLFEKNRRRGREATIRFHRDEERSDEADASSNEDDDEESSEEDDSDEDAENVEEQDGAEDAQEGLEEWLRGAVGLGQPEVNA